MPAEVRQFLCASDNFGVLVHDPATGATASIDALRGRPGPRRAQPDGLDADPHPRDPPPRGPHRRRRRGPKARFPGRWSSAPRPTRRACPALDVSRGRGRHRDASAPSRRASSRRPATRSGHIVYHFPAEKLLFAGDTLFAMGCGRAVRRHAGADVVLASAKARGAARRHAGLLRPRVHALQRPLRRWRSIPTTTALKSARRARWRSCAPRASSRCRRRSAIEQATNPFFRAADPACRSTLGLDGAAPVDVFAELRERKNRG